MREAPSFVNVAMFVSSLSLYNTNDLRCLSFYAKSRTCSFIAYNIKLLGMPKSTDKIKLIETKTQMGIELLLSESRFRIFKMEDEMKYAYEAFLKGEDANEGE